MIAMVVESIVLVMGRDIGFVMRSLKSQMNYMPKACASRYSSGNQLLLKLFATCFGGVFQMR